VGDEVEVVCIFDVGVPVTTADNTIGIPQLDVTELGYPNYVLTTDGAGNLSFTAKSEETAASLGLVIGTDVQGYHADLTTLATNGIGIGNNQFIQLNGSAQLPAVSGANLTNLPVGDMGGTMTDHIIPDTDDVYDIGSSANKIRDLYLSSNSLHIGDADISSVTDSYGYNQLILPNVQMTGHILPDTNAVYDLGSAEKKIRHLFLSDNSLWVGDDHKVSVTGGKQRTKKRKKGKIPTLILNTLVGVAPKPFLTETELKDQFKIDIHDPAPDPTVDPGHVDFQPLVHQWLHFAVLHGMGGAVNPENIFDDDEDFEEEGGGGLIFLATATASNAADFQITTGDNLITTDYDCYVIDLINCTTSYNNDYISMQLGWTSNGTDTIWQTSQYKNSGSQFVFITNQGANNGVSLSMSIRLWNPLAGAADTHVSWSGAASDYSEDAVSLYGGQNCYNNTPMPAFRIFASNGNISGKMNLYGITKG
jgi:hypothetical protein